MIIIFKKMKALFSSTNLLFLFLHHCRFLFTLYLQELLTAAVFTSTIFQSLFTSIYTHSGLYSHSFQVARKSAAEIQKKKTYICIHTHKKFVAQNYLNLTFFRVNIRFLIILGGIYSTVSSRCCQKEWCRSKVLS